MLTAGVEFFCSDLLPVPFPFLSIPVVAVPSTEAVYPFQLSNRRVFLLSCLRVLSQPIDCPVV